jgi:hypothetical protein
LALISDNIDAHLPNRTKDKKNTWLSDVSDANYDFLKIIMESLFYLGVLEEALLFLKQRFALELFQLTERVISDVQARRLFSKLENLAMKTKKSAMRRNT